MANNNKIERAAVRAVGEYLDKCPKLEPYIDSNDKTPIWDGDIYIYKNDKHKNENFFARVPLQVKGTTIAEDNTFRINREYLDGFKAEQGTAFFMVKVDENSSNVFYALLSSKDIDILLQKRAQTIKIKLKPVPTYPLDFQNELYAFAAKRNSEKIENPPVIKPQSNNNIGDGKRNENSSVILNLINGLIRSLKILFGGKKYPSEIKPLMEGFEEIRKHLDKIGNKEAKFELEGLLDNIKNLKVEGTVGWRDKFYFFSRKAIDLAINNIEGYDFANLQFKLGKYLQDQKQYHLAENYYSKVLKECRKRAETNPYPWRKSDVAAILNNLAVLHMDLTRYDEAEKEYKEALKLYRELAQTNRDAYIGVVAQALNNLGNLHWNLTRYDEAEEEYKEALEIRRELAKTNRDAYIGDVAQTLNNLGNLHYDLTRYDEAEKEYKEALEIRRELAETNRDAYIADVAQTLNNLAILHKNLTHYDEAEEEYKEALKIRRELANTNRDAYIGDVSDTLNNLAILHRKLTRYDEAEKEYKEALEIYRELAKTNRDAYIGKLAMTLYNIALLQEATDRKAEAKKNAEEALRIRKELAEAYPQIWNRYIEKTERLINRLNES